MGKADKRARKRQNQQLAREARDVAVKKAKRNKQFLYIGIAVVLVFGFVGLATITGGKDKKKVVAPTTTVDSNPIKCSNTVPAKRSNGKTYKTVPKQTVDAKKKYKAVIETSCGSITADLDAVNSPIGTNNFVFLAREGYFNGIKWARASKGFVIQGGAPDGTTSGGPGYSIVTESPKQDFVTGDLAWAKAGNEKPGSAGSQFFVTTGSPGSLNSTKKGSTYDYGYFGHVTVGLDIAQRIEGFAPPEGDGALTQDVYILNVKISETS